MKMDEPQQRQCADERACLFEQFSAQRLVERLARFALTAGCDVDMSIAVLAHQDAVSAKDNTSDRRDQLVRWQWFAQIPARPQPNFRCSVGYLFPHRSAMIGPHINTL